MTDSRAATAQGQPALAPAPALAPELYPQYCFHLSPTINKWCHLRAADIVALSSHPGFQGQDLYFHLNHPIKWARICGIVIAIDVYGDAASRKGQIRVVTIDDSSGETMDCVIPLAPPSPGPVAQLRGQQRQQQQQTLQSLPVIDGEIDIGHTLDIKGSLRTFRDQRQLKVEKIVHLKKTEEEVAFWERVVQLRREVLDKPWILEEKVVRRLRREAMGVDPGRDGKKREREKEKEEARKERKRKRRLQILEEEQKMRGVKGKGEKEEVVEEMEMGAEMEEKERKRMKRLEEERRARGLAAREEEILKRKAAEELEEREKERKRMKRLEERMRLEKDKKAGGESEVIFASDFTTARHAQAVVPTRAKKNITGLERRIPVSRAPIPPRPKEPTGLERKSKSSRSVSSDRVVPVTGKYKALGL